MREVKWKGKIVRFSGFRTEGDYAVIVFGNHEIRIPLFEWKQLDIKEVLK